MSDSFDLHVTLTFSEDAAKALYRLMQAQGDLDLSRTLSEAVLLQDKVARAMGEGHEVLCRTSEGVEVPVVARPPSHGTNAKGPATLQ